MGNPQDNQDEKKAGGSDKTGVDKEAGTPATPHPDAEKDRVKMKEGSPVDDKEAGKASQTPRE